MGPNKDESPAAAPVTKIEREEIPSWLCAELNLPADKVATLEINSNSMSVYSTLVRYFANRAVDIDQTPPQESERVHHNPKRDTREWPGTLTSMFSPNACENWELYDDEEGTSPKKQPEKVCYAMGTGWAKVVTNPITPKANGVDATDRAEEEVEKDLGPAPESDKPVEGEKLIWIHHFQTGDPRPNMQVLSVFRTLVLYAASPEDLRQVCRDSMRWKHEHMNRRQKATPGTFVLFTLKVYSSDMPPRWICHGKRKSRAISSIILRDGQMEQILAEFREFLGPQTKTWYERHGLSYRRQILFYGAPGGGKTSTVKALAGHFKLKACFLSLSHRNFGDHTMHEALGRIPKPCILVLEDVDVLFNERRQNESTSALTFSGLLNAVDGLVSESGVIMVMTTNHIEKLDPALLRCGRVDRRFEFPMPGKPEIANLFKSFYPEATNGLAKKFAEIVFGRSEKEARSIATLQEHFIYTRTSTAEESIKKLPEFFDAFFPNGGQNGNALYI